jgi:DNA-binding MarR family transcriptional regulator
VGFLDKKDILKLSKELEDLKKENSQLKEGYDDILDTANENTNEIQSNYAYISDLDKRISKLNDRIDEISMMMKHIIAKSDFSEDKQQKISPLSPAEKKLFLVLYTSDKMNSYKDLAFSTDITESLVVQYITSLIEKGVPIIKQYTDGKPLIGLSSKFKEMQAKNNLISLS